MSAVIHHGPPGSYKTFAIIQRVIIPALVKGRTVVTNIRGLNSVDKIAQAMGSTIHQDSKLVNVEHGTDEGFNHIARFFHWADFGALIVIDEAQEAYPTRLKNLNDYDIPEHERTINEHTQEMCLYTVEKAFDKHRHMNWDIYLSTPNIAKIHKEVRQVCEFAYRHRDMSGALPWWKNTWREFKHDPESSGKSVSHYIGTPVRYQSDPRVFDTYRSTATGITKDSNEHKGVLSDPKLRVFIGIAVLAISTFIYQLSAYMSDIEDDFTVAQDTDLQGPRKNDFITHDHDPTVTGDQVSDASDHYLAPSSGGMDAQTPNIDTTLEPYINSLPDSAQWRVSGVLVGHSSRALLQNTQGQSMAIDLTTHCYNNQFEWLCHFDNKRVTARTGYMPQNTRRGFADVL